MPRFTIIAPLAGLTAIGACASAPPMDVCSADWISYRAERAMDEFGSEVQPMLRTLRNASDQSKNGDVGPLMMVRLISAMTEMVATFENSRALDDLQQISRQCDDPDVMMDAFSDFLRDRGASPDIVRIIEDMSVLKRMMEDGDLR